MTRCHQHHHDGDASFGAPGARYLRAAADQDAAARLISSPPVHVEPSSFDRLHPPAHASISSRRVVTILVGPEALLGRPLEIRLERHEEPGRLATRYDTVVEGE
jgi:hypothetical protein